MELTKLNKEKGKRKPSADLGSMVFGKVPPQAKEIEEAVLGAIMLEREAYDRASQILKPDCFYVEAHQRIFRAMARLTGKSQPIDTLTVSEELRAQEELDMVGGTYYVIKLTNSVVSGANIEAHSRIILQKFIQREIIRISGELIGSAYEDMCDPMQLLEDAEDQLGGIFSSINAGDMTDISTVLIQAVQQIETWRKNDDILTGVPSGFPELDKATRGWQNTDLIILAARPSVGKTAFALNLIRNAAEFFSTTNKPGMRGKSVAVWSLEMKAMKLILRMIAAQSKEILLKIQTGRLDDDQFKRIYRDGIQKLAALNIFFDDNPSLTIQKLRSKARRLKHKNNLGLIVLDYLQLMGSEEKKGSREQEISTISRQLKNLAMELEVPIIALSQLNRDIEKRNNPEPQLSDLRESGAIEQDADLVMFLWAPSEADIMNNAELLTRRYAKIAKQRDGVLLKIELNFRDEIQLFESIEKASGMVGNWRPVESVPAPGQTRNFYETEKDDSPF